MPSGVLPPNIIEIDIRHNGNGLIETRDSPIQGRGVFAVKKIRKGTRIIEYMGERISHEEADERYDDEKMERHHTFLFEVDEDVVIDAGRLGNAAKYINHSCEPNCEAVNEDGQIFIEALRTIQPGEEITYDYAYEHEGELTPRLKRLYNCCCGSEKCRGTILKVKPKKRGGKKRKKSRTA